MEKITYYFSEYPIIGQILTALAILIVGRWIAKFIVKLLNNMVKRANVEVTTAQFITHFSYLALLCLVLLMALGEVGVQTASLLTVVGAAGLAIGLSLQSSLSNFAAGIMLVVFKPFKKGDMIFANGIEGTVEEVQIFTTVLRDDFNLCHVFPNSLLTSGTITNIWSNVERRLEFNIGVAYDENLDDVITCLEKALQANPLILDDPAPFVGVRSLDDSSVNVMVWVWIHRPNYRKVRFLLYKELKMALDAQNIVIAFPQCDVHLNNEKADRIAS